MGREDRTGPRVEDGWWVGPDAGDGSAEGDDDVRDGGNIEAAGCAPCGGSVRSARAAWRGRGRSSSRRRGRRGCAHRAAERTAPRAGIAAAPPRSLRARVADQAKAQDDRQCEHVPGQTQAPPRRGHTPRQNDAVGRHRLHVVVLGSVTYSGAAPHDSSGGTCHPSSGCRTRGSRRCARDRSRGHPRLHCPSMLWHLRQTAAGLGPQRAAAAAASSEAYTARRASSAAARRLGQPLPLPPQQPPQQVAPCSSGAAAPNASNASPPVTPRSPGAQGYAPRRSPPPHAAAAPRLASRRRLPPATCDRSHGRGVRQARKSINQSNKQTNNPSVHPSSSASASSHGAGLPTWQLTTPTPYPVTGASVPRAGPAIDRPPADNALALIGDHHRGPTGHSRTRRRRPPNPNHSKTQ
eukprot:scaffold415_cov362-Prasinococcus_capsulatus_cf.AAC.8